MQELQVEYKYLTNEQKIRIAYQTLLCYTEDYLTHNYLFQNYRTNARFKILLKMLDDINIFNKTIRYIDWKHPDRYIIACIRIINKIRIKYNSYKEICHNKNIKYIDIKYIVL